MEGHRSSTALDADVDEAMMAMGNMGVPGHVTSSSSTEQVLMWQQPLYESGFISGATSQAASETTSLTAASSIAAVSTFQELDAISDVSSVPSSVVRHLNQASPEEEIPNLAKLLVDEDQMVVDKCMRSIVCITKARDKREFQETMVRSQQFVQAVVHALNSALLRVQQAANRAQQEQEGQERGAGEESGELKNETLETANQRLNASVEMALFLSDRSEGIAKLIRSNGIPVLIQILSLPYSQSVLKAVISVHNILRYPRGDTLEEIKRGVRQASAPKTLMTFLDLEDNKPRGPNRDVLIQLQTVVVDCLHILAIRHEATKKLIMQLGAAQKLVKMLSMPPSNNGGKLVVKTCKLLQVLTVCPDATKRELIQMGALDALGEHLQSPSSEIKFNSILAIRNLSNTGHEHVRDLPGLVDRLLQSADGEAMAEPPPSPMPPERQRDANRRRENMRKVEIYACDTLSNLTVSNEAVKMCVLQSGGLTVLMQHVDKFLALNTNRVECDAVYSGEAEGAAGTIKFVLSIRNNGHNAQHELVCMGGVDLMVRLIHVHMRASRRHWDTLRHAVGVLKVLALNNDAPIQQALLRANVSVLAYQLAMNVAEGLMSKTVRGSTSSERSAMQLLEVATSLLAALLREPHHRRLPQILEMSKGVYVNGWSSIIRSSDVNDNVKRCILRILEEIGGDDQLSHPLVLQNEQLIETVRQLGGQGDAIGNLASRLLMVFNSASKKPPQPFTPTPPHAFSTPQQQPSMQFAQTQMNFGPQQGPHQQQMGPIMPQQQQNLMPLHHEPMPASSNEFMDVHQQHRQPYAMATGPSPMYSEDMDTMSPMGQVQQPQGQQGVFPETGFMEEDELLQEVINADFQGF